jgi:ParB family chromosome partitioning protein
LRIDEILIGDRVRKDMGDIESLAESMKRHGLLHPVVVKTDGTLVIESYNSGRRTSKLDPL